jgi:hypothetical protein
VGDKDVRQVRHRATTICILSTHDFFRVKLSYLTSYLTQTSTRTTAFILRPTCPTRPTNNKRRACWHLSSGHRTLIEHQLTVDTGFFGTAASGIGNTLGAAGNTVGQGVSGITNTTGNVVAGAGKGLGDAVTGVTKGLGDTTKGKFDCGGKKNGGLLLTDE